MSVNGHFPALQAEEGEEQGTSHQNLKGVKKPRLEKVRKPRLKGENQIPRGGKHNLEEEKKSVVAQLAKRTPSTSRSGRVLKTPKKFLSPGGEEHDGGKMQIRQVKKVKVQLAKLPREDVERLMVQKDDSVAKFPRKEKKLSIQTEVVENAAANPRMRELCNFMEVLGEEDHVEMGDENLNNEAPLKRGSGGVQELLDSWEDWESGAASVSLEVPWRAVESERFGGFDFPKVDSMLVTDDGDKTALVMSHDGDESEHMTSELDPSSLLNCMELTLFGGEGELKRGASRSPGLRN